MIKVSITLPNSVQITLESDSEIVHEIVAAVLRDLPKELLFGGSPVLNGADQLNISQLGDLLSRLQALLAAQDAKHLSQLEEASPGTGAGNSSPVPGNPTPVPENLTDKNLSPAAARTTSHGQGAAAAFTAAASEASFVQFCRSVNPLGDMRRVVVAAEGAKRFLQADGVDAEELSRLFDLASWPQPHSFTQTLRNAARSKFRWIERMPGRNGHYWVTEKGQEIAHQT